MVHIDQDRQQIASDGIAFWTKHTKVALTSLLNSVGSYSQEEQASHVKFLEDYVIPSMGPAPEPSHARSLLTPNGSPFEISLNHSDKGKSRVRFCYEPVFSDCNGGAIDPIPAIAEQVGADMQWFNQFAKAFYPTAEDDVALRTMMPKDTFHIPKVFLAFDLEDDKRRMKAYFYPVIKYMTSKSNSDRSTFDLIRSLCPLGTSFRPALDMIEEYQKLLYQDPPLTVVVGLDCISPNAGARIKIYIEPQSNAWSAVQQHVTLGGKLRDRRTLEGLSILRDMWNLLINEPEDKVIGADFSKPVPVTTPKSSGACFSWELAPGKDIPDTKVYLPMNQYFKNDKTSIEAIEKVFRKRGWSWGVEGAYKKAISDACGKDVVDENIETPTVHTFVSFSFSEKKGVYMTTYAAPFVRFA